MFLIKTTSRVDEHCYLHRDSNSMQYLQLTTINNNPKAFSSKEDAVKFVIDCQKWGSHDTSSWLIEEV